MGTHRLLIMKFVNIVLLGAAGCFAFPSQVNQNNKNQLNQGAKALTRQGLNWINGILAQGDNTKDLKAGKLLDAVVKAYVPKTYVRGLQKWFQPCVRNTRGKKHLKQCRTAGGKGKGKGGKVPTVRQYLKTVETDMAKTCSGQLCHQIQEAVLKNLRANAAKNRLMDKPADNAYFTMVNKMIPGLVNSISK